RNAFECRDHVSVDRCDPSDDQGGEDHTLIWSHAAGSSRNDRRRLPERRAPSDARSSPIAASQTQNTCRNIQYNEPDNKIAAGKVNTQANARLRPVLHCNPDPLAAIVPATPLDSTCVVETGKPNMSAAPMVVAATSSAEAPCA